MVFTGDGGLADVPRENCAPPRGRRCRCASSCLQDDDLSLIKIKQEQRGYRTDGVAIGEIDWPAVGAGMGVASRLAGSEESLRACLRETAEDPGPVLIAARISARTYPDMLRALRGSRRGVMTRRLAEVLAAVTYADLPGQVVEDTRRSVLDWLGSALAGSVEPPARMAQRVVAGLGTSDEATVFGAGRASAAGAALANGVASHILELDDVHKGSTLHAGAPIIPAALAVAEREHAGGRSFLLAVAVGYEAALRIGEAVNPSHYRFWHPTGTAATFGAAAAAGSLLQVERRANARCAGQRGHAGRGPVGIQCRWRHEQAPASRQGGVQRDPGGRPGARGLHRRDAASWKASADSSAP